MTAAPTPSAEQLDALEKRLRDNAHSANMRGAYSRASTDASAADAIKALRQQVVEYKAQLPEEMESCTIKFLECEKGHGRLWATNWIDHGCHHCELTASRERVERLEKDAGRWRNFRRMAADKPIVTEADIDAEFDAEMVRRDPASDAKEDK